MGCEKQIFKKKGRKKGKQKKMLITMEKNNLNVIFIKFFIFKRIFGFTKLESRSIFLWLKQYTIVLS